MPKILDVTGDAHILVKELHDRMQLGYQMPNLTDPLFCVKKIILEDGEPVAAGALKLTSEAFLWLDPNNCDYTKAAHVARLMELCKVHATDLCLQDVTAWIPPQVEQKFAKMLGAMGWTRSPWSSWSVRI